MAVNTIHLSEEVRQRGRRHWRDFVIDGRALGKILDIPDVISGFGWTPADFEQAYARRLALRAPADIEPDRVALYVCPECANLGCGAVTVSVEETDRGFKWSRFGFENNYDPGMADFESYVNVGPFEFDKDRYLGVLATGGGIRL